MKTPSQRIAETLGINAPARGHFLPTMTGGGATGGGSASIGPTLHLFGARDAPYFSDENSDDESRCV